MCGVGSGGEVEVEGLNCVGLRAGWAGCREGVWEGGGSVCVEGERVCVCVGG